MQIHFFNILIYYNRSIYIDLVYLQKSHRCIPANNSCSQAKLLILSMNLLIIGVHFPIFPQCRDHFDIKPWKSGQQRCHRIGRIIDQIIQLDYRQYQRKRCGLRHQNKQNIMTNMKRNRSIQQHNGGVCMEEHISDQQAEIYW